MGNSVQGRALNTQTGNPLSATADMMAAALRGATKATLGLPGDIEGLFRDKTALPTTQDVDKMLPPLGTPNHPYEEIGQFLPLPSAIPAVNALRKGAGAVKSGIAKAEAPMSDSRRDFLKKGAGAAALAATPMGAKMASEALRAIPAPGALPEAVATTAAKVATRWTPALVAGSIDKLNDLIGGAVRESDITPEIMEGIARNFKSVDELKNLDAWQAHWADPYADLSQYKDEFDQFAAAENFKNEALKMGYDPIQVGTQHIIGGKPEDVKMLYEKHWPRSAHTDNYEQTTKALDFMYNIPQEKVLNFLKTTKPGEVPPEWARYGVQPHHIAYRGMPIHGPGPSRMSDLESTLYSIQVKE